MSTEPRPDPKDYGFDSDEEVYEIVKETMKARREDYRLEDLPLSVRLYNADLLAWHERTNTPYETDAEYRAKITKGGQS